MYQHSKNYILTFVYVLFFIPFLAHAAPFTDFPPDQIDSGLHPKPKEEPRPRTDFSESTSITPTNSPLPKEFNSTGEIPIIPTRKLSQEAIFFTAGMWVGSVVDNSMSNSITYLRIGKSVYDIADTATEYTLDLSTSGNFGWSAGYKFLQDLGKFYEPYMKVAVGAFYSGGQIPATLIDWQRYQLRGEIGCEDLFNRSRSLRTELGFSWSGFGAAVYLGASYAF